MYDARETLRAPPQKCLQELYERGPPYLGIFQHGVTTETATTILASTSSFLLSLHRIRGF